MCVSTASDALELELQVAVNYPMEVARELNLGPLEKQKALLTAKIFLQLPSLIILESTKVQSKNPTTHLSVYIRQIKYYLNSYFNKFQCRFSLSN